MTTVIPFEDDTESQAVLLLAAAQEKGLDASVIQTQSSPGGFLVPDELAQGSDEKKPAAKKTTAKKTAASKSTSTASQE